MNKNLKILKDAAVFKGINENEIERVLKCLGTKTETYEKNEYILHAGDSPDAIGLIVQGNALIIQEDYWGNRNIIAKVSPPSIFAESFACTPRSVMNISVVSEDESAIMWLNVSELLNICPTACSYHSKIINNLLSELALKNLRLNEKLTHMGQRTTKEKVLSYLSFQSQKQNKLEFDIMFNRQQLADYLSVERSALSSELSKLRNEGIIDYNKNHFVLK